MIEFLLLDLDDTILDFHKAERIAISKTIREFGVEPTDEVLARYHVINKWHWEQLEQGKLTRAEVLENRFGVLFDELGVKADKAVCARAYEKNLSIGHYFLPGAEAAMEQLSQKYQLYMVTNGTAHVQRPKLAASGVGKYFKDIFISELMGADKPSAEYFARCFARIPGFDIGRAMIVGDSLSSDIQGGINVGMRTCWVNPDHKKGNISADYEIENLSQMEALLDAIDN